MSIDRTYNIVNRLKTITFNGTNIISIIIGAAALIIGIILGKFIFAKNTKKQVEEAEKQAQKIIAEGQLQAENLKKRKTTGSQREICSDESRT